jgi:hypothetical protein
MGIKISNMTTTGSAPIGSYVPIAYAGENYKIELGLITTYDSGWSASTVSLADTVTLTHNLGRTDLIAMIWFSKSSESTKGDNPFQADLTWDLNNDPYGGTITNLTTTQVTLQIGMKGINYTDSAGSDSGPVDCYYRIILK